MKERPIIFKDEMVRAILEGRKTQTRRIVKPQPRDDQIMPREWSKVMRQNKNAIYGDGLGWCAIDESGNDHEFRCPYGQPGDNLVVAIEIPSFGRNYCAGSDGVIYSRARGDWRPLKAHGNGNGYPCVTVMDGSRKTTRTVHSLVCEAFYGAQPFSGAQVRHLDGDTSNSKPSNLAWGTQAENWRDRRCHGNGIEGEKHHAAKLSDSDRAHVRWAIERGLCSQRHAARALGITQSAVGQLMIGCELANVEQDIPVDRVPLTLLEITGVRVERLQEISEADAIAEGIEQMPCSVPNTRLWRNYQPSNGWTPRVAMPRNSFCSLWQYIYGHGSWDENPWVWVIEFKRTQP